MKMWYTVVPLHANHIITLLIIIATSLFHFYCNDIFTTKLLQFATNADIVISDCNKIIKENRAFFKDFSVEGPTTERDFREKRKSGEVFPFGGSGGTRPKLFCIFELPIDLISCNFSTIFAHFQTKRDITRGPKSFSGGVGGGGNMGGGLWLLQYIC